mgnify:CR=1 FL=1
MRGIISNRMLKNHKAIKALTLSDFGVWSGSSLIATIFPLFVINQIPGATVTDAGIASMLYLGFGAVLNLPLGNYMDKHKGYIDELYLLAGSNLFRGIALLFMAFNTNLYFLFLLQILLGISKSMNYMSWRILFTKFLDPYNLGKEWGIYDTIMSLGFGVAAFLGGYLGENLGFNIVIIIGGIMSLISTIFPLMSYKEVDGVK